MTCHRCTGVVAVMCSSCPGVVVIILHYELVFWRCFDVVVTCFTSLDLVVVRI